MSTSAGTLLSFLRFRTRRGRGQFQAEPVSTHPVSPEPLGPGLATLVRVPERPAPTAATPTGWIPAPRVPPEPTMLARVVPPEPRMLARVAPDAALLTPAATVPTVPMPVMAEPATAVPGLAAPDDGVETTLLPSRRDAPETTIHPRRAG
jgi:hypothetical protein